MFSIDQCHNQDLFILQDNTTFALGVKETEYIDLGMIYAKTSIILIIL